MKKIALVVSLWILYQSPAHACDVCNIFEYKPFNTNNYIGFFYHYRKFNGYNDLGHSNSFFNKNKMHELDGSNLLFEKRKADYEQYHTSALRLNYVFLKKYNLLLVVPHEKIKVYYNKVWSFTEPVADTTINLSGLGDVILSIDRNIIIDSDERRHLIRPGIAIELPTGRTDYRSIDGELFDPDLQPGSGSWDMIYRLNYLNLSNNGGWAYSAAVNYKVSGRGAQNYRFGNSWNTQLQVQYVLMDEEKELNFIPKMGAFAEGANKNTQSSEELDYTGGKSLFWNIGFDIQLRDWAFQTLFQLPIAQDRNANQIGNAGRLNMSLVRSF